MELYDIDWTSSMQQTYEFYKVNPDTWEDVEKIDCIESCRIQRDTSNDTLGSASFNCSETIDECYIRTYLVCIQNGKRLRVCLGTHLVQAPSFSFNGKRRSITMDGYTPLIELKNTMPPIGFAVLKTDRSATPPVETDILDSVFRMCSEHMRAPVVKSGIKHDLYSNFIATSDDTWFSFCSELLLNAEMQFDLEPDGRVMFTKDIGFSEQQPVWTFNDDNSSILLPDITDEYDLFDVPNIVEVIYSSDTATYYSRIVNDDEASPVSLVNRGREVIHRETDPEITGIPSQEYIDKYAENLLKSLSTLKHSVTYSHAYCPVRVGDSVMLNYRSAGLNNVKAKVQSQSIDCKTGCIVEETAIYVTKLWR